LPQRLDYQFGRHREKFNLEEEDIDNICQPSPYGYRMIAEYIADLLRVNNIPAP
jgi:hypothetical protein